MLKMTYLVKNNLRGDADGIGGNTICTILARLHVALDVNCNKRNNFISSQIYSYVNYCQSEYELLLTH